jgi:hypothetical protein
MGSGVKKSIISLILLLSFPIAALAAAAPLELRADAPERHTVMHGDTLWALASRFLKDPWRWPELWNMNKAQIRNPDRIYPGDTLVLERRESGEGRLRVENEKVAPHIRVEPLESDAIRTIAPSDIEAFLSRPLVVGRNDLDRLPEIMATEEDRVVLGAGNVAYARGLEKSGESRWQIFRRGDALVDPDTGETLGYTAVYLGESELRRAGPVSTIAITKATQEIYRGDKLRPVPRETPVFAYVPHSSQNPVRGRILSTYGGLRETGPLAIVAVSKGSRDGMEVGQVLALYRDQRSTRYAQRTEPLYGRGGPTGNDRRIPYYPADIGAREAPVYASARPVRDSDFAQLPAERYGLVMIFRTFERASFALVMQASRPVAVSDIIANP